ncbi:MAG: hypothetical protein MZV63_63760 [Marinilabiliales bacterium]|nr:hypothetical protein [Marinilabiliales bacterium]
MTIPALEDRREDGQRTGETVNITLRLKNTGNYDSDEVVQLYASFPGSEVERPAMALKDSSKSARRQG